MKIPKVSDDEIAAIKRLLRYEEGKVFWREDRNSRIKSGDRAGSLSSSGYRVIKLKGRPHKEHRIIWILINGTPPLDTLDHINGIKDDNRPSNLRELSHKENHRAHKNKKKGASSKYRGVHWSQQKWRALITTDGKLQHIGRFTSEIEAARAYDKKAIELGFDVQALNFKEEWDYESETQRISSDGTPIHGQQNV